MQINEIYYADNLPYFFDGEFSYPLILELSELNATIQRKAIENNDNECIEQLRSYYEYILDCENHNENLYELIAINSYHDWLKEYSNYIEDTSLKYLVDNFRQKNLFGVIVYDALIKANLAKIFLMTDFIPNCNLKFTEEHFWTLIETDFMSTYKFFGGWNVTRKITGKYRDLYKPGKIAIEKYSKPMSKIDMEEYIPESDLCYNYVNISPLEIVLASYDTETKVETMIKNGIYLESRIQLFEYVENYNLANIIAYAEFQKFKLYHNNYDYVYAPDSELNLDWNIKELE